jgi:hypothetical protein
MVKLDLGMNLNFTSLVWKRIAMEILSMYIKRPDSEETQEQCYDIAHNNIISVYSISG